MDAKIFKIHCLKKKQSTGSKYYKKGTKGNHLKVLFRPGRI